MPFALFILVNAILFVRPAELVPELEGARLYEAAILACLVSAAPRVLRQLGPGSLARRPLTVCVLGLFVAVVLSLLAFGDAAAAADWGFRYFKIVLYFLLLMAVVDTTARLRRFLACVAVLILALTTLTLLQHHEVINLPALEAIQQADLDRETGEWVRYPRLCGMGIFNDPNDLSIILVVGVMICLGRLGGSGPAGLLWLAPVGLMGYALVLTRSRGGLLALLGALAVLLVGRVGVRRAVLLGAPVLVAVFAVGGRQTSFDLGDKEDTGQHRIRLWRDGLVLLKGSPIFGIGAGRYDEECGLVAHNSFIHAYTELGVPGGTLFLAAFVLPVVTLHRLGGTNRLSPALRRLRTPVMASLVGLCVGMISLSRVYTLTPYLVLGLVAVYFRLAAPAAPGAVPRLTPRRVVRTAVFGALFLVAADVFVRLFAGVG